MWAIIIIQQIFGGVIPVGLGSSIACLKEPGLSCDPAAERQNF